MLLLRKSSFSLVKTRIPRVNVSLSDQKYVHIYSMTLIIHTLLKKRDRDIINASIRPSVTYSPKPLPNVLRYFRSWQGCESNIIFPFVRPSMSPSFVLLSVTLSPPTIYETYYITFPHNMSVQEQHYFSIRPSYMYLASVVRSFVRHTNLTKLATSLPIMVRVCVSNIIFRASVVRSSVRQAISP